MPFVKTTSAFIRVPPCPKIRRGPLLGNSAALSGKPEDRDAICSNAPGIYGTANTAACPGKSPAGARQDRPGRQSARWHAIMCLISCRCGRTVAKRRPFRLRKATAPRVLRTWPHATRCARMVAWRQEARAGKLHVVRSGQGSPRGTRPASPGWLPTRCVRTARRREFVGDRENRKSSP